LCGKNHEITRTNANGVQQEGERGVLKKRETRNSTVFVRGINHGWEAVEKEGKLFRKSGAPAQNALSHHCQRGGGCVSLEASNGRGQGIKWRSKGVRGKNSRLIQSKRSFAKGDNLPTHCTGVGGEEVEKKVFKIKRDGREGQREYCGEEIEEFNNSFGLKAHTNKVQKRVNMGRGRGQKPSNGAKNRAKVSKKKKRVHWGEGGRVYATRARQKKGGAGKE